MSSSLLLLTCLFVGQIFSIASQEHQMKDSKRIEMEQMILISNSDERIQSLKENKKKEISEE